MHSASLLIHVLVKSRKVTEGSSFHTVESPIHGSYHARVGGRMVADRLLMEAVCEFIASRILPCAIV